MTKVSDIMRKYVITCGPELSVAEAARIMSNNRVGSVIITENQKPVGIITSEDIVDLVSKGKDPKKITLASISKKSLITAKADDAIVSVARKMSSEGIKRVPVVKDGNIVGIVTEKELLLAMPGMLEVLSERLKARVDVVAEPRQVISGICEDCEGYSDSLRNVGGRWFCPECRER